MNQKIDKDIIHKELDLIQDVVKRMTNNSFLAKGWLITLLGIILALTKDNLLNTEGTFTLMSTYIYALLCLPILMFWYLDAYFLWQERFYRHLYNWVIVERQKGSEEQLYALNPHVRFKDKTNVKSIWKSITSETLMVFYSLPLILCATMLFFVRTKSYLPFIIGSALYIFIVLYSSFNKK